MTTASYQVIYNPYTKEIKQIDLNQANAMQTVMSYYQQGWTSPPSGAQIPAYPSPTPAPAPTATISPRPITQEEPIATISTITMPKAAEAVPSVDLAKPPANSTITQEEWDRLGKSTKTAILRGDVVPTQYVSPEVYAQLGKGVKERGLYAPKLTIWHKLYGTEAPLGSAESWKRAGIWGTEAIVPYVYTARHWSNMSATERGLNLALDTLVAAPLVKSAPRAIRAIKNVKVTTKTMQESRFVLGVAKQTGQARNDLRRSITALESFERTGYVKAPTAIPTSKLHTILITNMERASVKSAQADAKFADLFGRMKAINPKALRIMERRSGFIGLEQSVNEISAQNQRIKALWQEADKAAKTHGIGSEEHRIYMKALQYRYGELDKALIRHAEIMSPKSRKGIDVADLMPKQEISGYKIRLKIAERNKPLGGWEPRKPHKPKGKAMPTEEYKYGEPQTAKAAQEAPKQKTKVETADEQARLWEQEFEPVYTEGKEAKAAREAAEEAEAAKKRAPKVEEPAPRRKWGLSPLSKEELAQAGARSVPQSIPSEAWGRMTPEQMAREYGNADDVIEDAIGKPIDQAKGKDDLKTASEINAKFEAGLASQLTFALDRFAKAYNRTGNERQAKEEAKNATRIQFKTKPENKTQIETKIETKIATDIDRIITRIEPPRKWPLPSEEEWVITKVKGMPDKAGVLSWDDGTHRIKLAPPFIEGEAANVDYDLLKRPRRGKGSQEQTLKVTGGGAPRMIELSRGFDLLQITRGKRMHHIRQSVSGAGIVDREGRSTKQKRGSLVY